LVLNKRKEESETLSSFVRRECGKSWRAAKRHSLCSKRRQFPELEDCGVELRHVIRSLLQLKFLLRLFFFAPPHRIERRWLRRKKKRMEQSVLDDIINRLLEVRTRPGKQVQLSESEIRQLCVVSRDIFLQQPNLLELEAPIKICGEFLFSSSPYSTVLITPSLSLSNFVKFTNNCS